MSNELSKALYAKVTGDNTFNTAIGGTASVAGRFYPDGDKKIETATKPYATYLIISQVPDDTLDAEIDNVLIQIKNVSDTDSKSTVDANNKLLRDLLQGVKLTLTVYKGVQLFRTNQIPAMKDENKLDWISTTDFRTKMQK